MQATNTEAAPCMRRTRSPCHELSHSALQPGMAILPQKTCLKIRYALPGPKAASKAASTLKGLGFRVWGLSFNHCSPVSDITSRRSLFSLLVSGYSHALTWRICNAYRDTYIYIYIYIYAYVYLYLYLWVLFLSLSFLSITIRYSYPA